MGIGDLFSNAPASNAAGYQAWGLKKGQKDAYSQIDTGQQGYTDQSNQALGYYDQLNGTGSAANTMYGNALGLNGTSGTQAAQDAYTMSPGTQFSIDQGLQAAERARAASGMLGSGNTSADAIKLAQGYASQDYGDWLDRLNGLNTQYGNTTNARAAITTGLGDKLYGTGLTKGQIAWNTDTGIGNAYANAEMNKYNVAGNTLGAAMGGATLGARLLGFNM